MVSVAPVASFEGNSTNGILLSFAAATGSSLASITWTADNWTTLGFQAGDQIAITGAGADDGSYIVAYISSEGAVLDLAAGSNLANQTGVADVSIMTQTLTGSFLGSSGRTLTVAAATVSSSATITTSGSWTTDGFLPGDQIAVSGAGADDGSYIVASISSGGTVLSLAAGSTLVSQSAVAGVSVNTQTATGIFSGGSVGAC